MKRAPGQEPDPVITVITVCRNAAATIRATLDSVLSQSYPKTEYIVIDGASTDGTLAIIDEYRDRLQTIVSEPDHGIYDAMNKGLRYATGDVVGYLMADDQYAPDALRRVADAWRREPATELIAGATRMRNAATSAESIATPTFRTSAEGRAYASVPHPSAFVARDAYARHGAYDTTFAVSADAEFFFRLAARNARFTPVPEVLAVFNSGGVSSRNAFAPILEHFHVRRRYGSLAAASVDLVRNTVIHWLLPRVARLARRRRPLR